MPVGIEDPNNFENKSASSSFKWLSMCILFLDKLKGGGRSFFWRRIEGEGGCMVRSQRAIGSNKRPHDYSINLIIKLIVKNKISLWCSKKEKFIKFF